MIYLFIVDGSDKKKQIMSIHNLNENSIEITYVIPEWQKIYPDKLFLFTVI